MGKKKSTTPAAPRPSKKKTPVIEIISDSESDGEYCASRGSPGASSSSASNLDNSSDPLECAAPGQAEARPSLTDALERVLEVFPDISIGFVQDLLQSRCAGGGADTTYPYEIQTEVIRHIADLDSYPTAREAAEKERESDVAFKETYDSQMQHMKASKKYRVYVGRVLQQAFPDITAAHINSTLAKSSCLSEAYVTLSEATDSNLLTKQRLRKKRRLDTSIDLVKSYDVPEQMVELVINEIHLGRKQRAQHKAERRAEMKDQRRERKAQAKGQVGHVPHAFCFECTRKHAENETNSGRCHPSCMDTSGCKAPFSEHQLRLCLTEASLARLIRLQQQNDLKAAGIEGLEDCPFCDYLAVCPPVVVDREFRCLNEDCMKVSCRLCSRETHIPLTCEKAAKQRDKDRIRDARHVLEEAMSDAIVRNCNKCKKRFVKTEGCNKMTCPFCHNKQCYVCHQDVDSYTHFATEDSTKCPLFDKESVEARHAQEAEVAATKAKAGISEKSEINVKDLNIQISKEAKLAESNRLQKANAEHALMVEDYQNRVPRQPHANGLQRINPQPLVPADHERFNGIARPAQQGRVLMGPIQRAPPPQFHQQGLPLVPQFHPQGRAMPLPQGYVMPPYLHPQGYVMPPQYHPQVHAMHQHAPAVPPGMRHPNQNFGYANWNLPAPAGNPNAAILPPNVKVWHHRPNGMQ